MKTAQPSLATYHPGRHLQVLDEKSHDPSQHEEKLAEPAVCDTCGAAYQEGRWTWTTPSHDAVQARCPACRRIQEKRPAGFVTMDGEFPRTHREELVNLVRETELRVKANHPLQRIMSLGEEGGKLQVETTDAQLARDIGDALLDAYQGDLDSHYSETEDVLRLAWKA